MGSIFVQTIVESFHRRVALAMVVVALLSVGVFFSTTFQHTDKGLVVISGRVPLPAGPYVHDHLQTLVTLSSNLWSILGMFAVAPLMASHLERGWAELLFAKGVARWQIVTARVAGSVCVYLMTLILLAVIPGTYLALRADVPLGPFYVGLLISLFSFIVYVALMLLVSTSQSNAGVLIGIGMLQMLVASVLNQRKSLYPVITWKWVQWLMDWAYRILPKTPELNQSAVIYMTRHTWDAWWATWSTALFVLVAAGWAIWRFQRRAI